MLVEWVSTLLGRIVVRWLVRWLVGWLARLVDWLNGFPCLYEGLLKAGYVFSLVGVAAFAEGKSAGFATEVS